MCSSDLLERLREALAACEIVGPASNIAFLERLVRHPVVVEGNIDTGYLDRHLDQFLKGATPSTDDDVFAAATTVLLDEEARATAAAGDPHSPWAANDAWRNAHPGKRLVALVVDGERRDVAAYGHDGMYRLKSGEASTEVTGARLADGVLTARFNGHARRCRVHLDAGHVAVHDAAGFRHAFERAPAFAWVLADAVGDDRVRAPMPGRIVLVRVSPGDTVTAGQDLLVMEAMKMELALKAPRDGTIESVGAAQGDFVEADRVLVRLAANDQA